MRSNAKRLHCDVHSTLASSAANRSRNPPPMRLRRVWISEGPHSTALGSVDLPSLPPVRDPPHHSALCNGLARSITRSGDCQTLVPAGPEWLPRSEQTRADRGAFRRRRDWRYSSPRSAVSIADEEAPESISPGGKIPKLRTAPPETEVRQRQPKDGVTGERLRVAGQCPRATAVRRRLRGTPR
jgi:hypothetical protein